jgi:hypothetical protein
VAATCTYQDEAKTASPGCCNLLVNTAKKW